MKPLTREQYEAHCGVLAHVKKIDHWVHKLAAEDIIDSLTYLRLLKGIDSARAALENKLSAGITYADGSLPPRREDPLEEMFEREIITYYPKNMTPKALERFLLFADHHHIDGTSEENL